MGLQTLVNALLLGGLYALMGAGFSLQWGISGIINLSYGTLVVLGSYFSLVMFDYLGIDPFISIISSGAALFLIGAVIYRVVLQPLSKSGIVFTLILTFAVSLILQNFMLAVWSADYRTIRVSYAGSSIELAGAYVPVIKLLSFFVALAFIAALYWFFKKAKTGKGIMAVALDKVGAQAVGIDIQKMYLINFALGAALAGAAGALWASIYSFSPHLVGLLVGKVFIIAIIGGLGNIWGAAAGGLVLGIAETAGATFVGSQWQEAIGFVIMVLVLIFRPYGLLGKKYFA
jgi:branched-chain amino acid transport system permease protein